MAGVLVGGETANVPSLQVYQDVYNTLTKKTETLVRYFFDKHIVGVSDLCNLHAALEQTVEQYDVKASSCSVVVRYADGKSERFSSFERFRNLGLERGVPCVDLEFEYDFLIILPKTSEAKPYKVEIGLRSGIGIIESFKLTNATETEQDMYFNLHSGTGRLDITYVDLAVARALQSVIEDWYRALRKKTEKRSWEVARKHSNILLALIKTLCLVITIVFFVLVIQDPPMSISRLFFALSLLLIVVTVVYVMSQPVLLLLKKAVSRSVISSAIILGSADNSLFERSQGNNMRLVGKLLFSSISTILLGIVSAWCAVTIGIN